MAQKENTSIFELLAPAGSPAILEAVIRAGADAVYLGGNRYGARAYAENFTPEQLLWALDYAHIRGRKIYLTVNTLLKNEEIDGLCDYIAPLYEHGLDAVLIQDFGALHIVREAFPDLPIHASTQMTLTGADGVRFLQEQGVGRVVLSRELSLEEAARIHEETGMELEVFVHGALCYCYSGQCLFSSMIGGRSGNRGRCAQPCRLPYTVSDEQNSKRLRDSYILSLKDLCGIEDLAALHQAGVYSLKIEGRMKQEAYAAGVVSYYRKYIDRYVSQISEGKISEEKPLADPSSLEMAKKQKLQKFSVTQEDKQMLSDLGNRCGFTDAYYWKRNGSDMITYDRPSYITRAQSSEHIASVSADGKKISVHKQGRDLSSTDEAINTVINKVTDKVIDIDKATDKVRITGHAVFRKGVPSEFSVWLSENHTCDSIVESINKYNDNINKTFTSVTVTGKVPEKAQKAPVTAEELRHRLMKTGDTPFVFTEIVLDADEDLFIPNGAVNCLRRDALDALEQMILSTYRRTPGNADTRKDDIMSASEKNACLHAFGERRMPIMCNAHDIMSASEEGTCLRREASPLGHVSGERRMPILSALVSNPDQLAAVLADGRMAELYLETVTYPRKDMVSEIRHCLHMIEDTNQDYAVYLALPPVFRQHTREFYTSIAQQLSVGQVSLNEAHDQIQGFLVRNYEEFAWVEKYFPQAKRIIDHHLYTYNDASVAAFFAAGADRNTIPLELNRAEIFRRDNRHGEMVIYGYYPLMLSAQCVHANSSGNSKKNGVSRLGCDRCSVVSILTDRKGIQFPVCNFCSECVNVIYNSVPTMLFGRMNELMQKGIWRFRLEFTMESPKEVSDILACLPQPKEIYEHLSDKQNAAIKQTQESVAHTNGHYTRGVE